MDALDYINEGAGEEDEGNKDPITESGNLKNQEDFTEEQIKLLSMSLEQKHKQFIQNKNTKD